RRGASARPAAPAPGGARREDRGARGRKRRRGAEPAGRRRRRPSGTGAAAVSRRPTSGAGLWQSPSPKWWIPGKSPGPTGGVGGEAPNRRSFSAVCRWKNAGWVEQVGDRQPAFFIRSIPVDERRLVRAGGRSPTGVLYPLSFGG